MDRNNLPEPTFTRRKRHPQRPQNINCLYHVTLQPPSPAPPAPTTNYPAAIYITTNYSSQMLLSTYILHTTASLPLKKIVKKKKIINDSSAPMRRRRRRQRHDVTADFRRATPHAPAGGPLRSDSPPRNFAERMISALISRRRWRRLRDPV